MNAEYEFRSNFNDKYSLTTRKLLRLISQDSRASVSKMSGIVGVSRAMLRKRLSKMEKELGIRYTIEINEARLKLTEPHIIAVKFNSEPDFAKITSLLSQSYIPQIAVSVKGDYSLIICAIATSSGEYAHWDKSMQIALSKYGVDWRSSEVVHRQLGFFPLRNELLDKVPLDQKHKNILKALNENSRASFRLLSKQVGMHSNTLAYNMSKLVSLGYINRFTITMDKPEDISLMSFFSKYRPTEGYEEASAHARQVLMSDDENSLMSRYLLCTPLIGSYDFFTIGAFDDAETGRTKDVEYHRALFKKHRAEIAYGEIDKVLIGRLPLRSMDSKKEYKTMKWTSEFKQ